MSALPVGALCFLLDGSVCSAAPDIDGTYRVSGVTGYDVIRGVQREALLPLDLRIPADRDAAAVFMAVCS